MTLKVKILPFLTTFTQLTEKLKNFFKGLVPSSIYSWSIQPLFLLHSKYEFEWVTLESMICRSVTKLNLVTYIFFVLGNRLCSVLSNNWCHKFSEYLAHDKIILPCILLPFPFSLMKSSLCYMYFFSCDYFVSDIRDVSIFLTVWKRTKALFFLKIQFT